MIQPETISGRKAYFNRMRALVNSQWIIDDNDVVHIPLGNGKEAFIDSCDMELASNFLWRLRRHVKIGEKFYAEATIPEDCKHLYNCSKKRTSLHRVLLNAPDGFDVDHVNGDGLDCRRSNIRIATKSQNASNRKYAPGIGKYRGVRAAGKKWQAQLEHKGRNRYLGSFSTREEAALRYNEEAIKIFGEFAILNDIEVSV